MSEFDFLKDLMGDDQFPWEDVNRSRKNKRLQKKHESDRFKEMHSDDDFKCPGCNKKPDELEWFYFKSPAWTWENLCGSEGWMVVCDDCKKQVKFYTFAVS